MGSQLDRAKGGEGVGVGSEIEIFESSILVVCCNSPFLD